jgi:hypothetical protein
VRGIVKAEAEATISTELVNRQRVTIHDRRRKLTPRIASTDYVTEHALGKTW